MYCEHPILWVACCHHVAELVVKGGFKCIFSDTTDPGVEIFRHLKKEWSSLAINYSSLDVLDLPTLPDWMKAEVEAVLNGVRKLSRNRLFLVETILSSSS